MANLTDNGDLDLVLRELSSLNEKLTETTNNSTNRAFNLGCAVGILPALFAVLATYFLSGKSWLGAVLIGVLMLLGLVLLSNLVADITRTNTQKRALKEEILPSLQTLAREYHLDIADFYQIASIGLLEDALLPNLLLNLKEGSSVDENNTISSSIGKNSTDH